MAVNADPAQQLSDDPPVEPRADDLESEANSEDTGCDVTGTGGEAGDAGGDGVSLVRGRRRTLLALAFGFSVVLALSGVGAWMLFQQHQITQAQRLENLLVKTGEQTALNMTSIDHTRVDEDIKRVLDGSSGELHDDFQNRSKPFADVVRQAQSKSTGTITASGLESRTGNEGQVLVAVTVSTVTAAVPEDAPRMWRMRIRVDANGDQATATNVEFVP